MRQARKGVFLGLLVLLFILYLVGFCWSDEKKSATGRFSLKLTGGARYVSVGDMNKHLDSFNSLPNVGGEIAPITNWSNDWELELRMRLSSKVGLGIATSGFFNKWNQTSLFMFGGDAWIPEVVKFDIQYVFRPEIKSAMPLGLNLYCLLYSSSKLNLVVNAGTGWYTGKMTEHLVSYYLQSDGGVYFGSRHWSVDNTFSLGFQGGFGAEYSITDELALVAEVQGRYARVGRLKGSMTHMINSGREEEKGTLFYYRTTLGEVGPWYTELVVRRTAPEGGFVSIKDVREARLDLSGFALRIGLRLRLF